MDLRKCVCLYFSIQQEIRRSGKFTRANRDTKIQRLVECTCVEADICHTVPIVVTGSPINSYFRLTGGTTSEQQIVKQSSTGGQFWRTRAGICAGAVSNSSVPNNIDQLSGRLCRGANCQRRWSIGRSREGVTTSRIDGRGPSSSPSIDSIV